MHALPFILGTLCVLALAYRYYSAFLAAKVACLDDSRLTPAHELRDGHNYVPTNKWVLFGHHFAAITGAGPLIGPTLAAQFGFLPGFLWLLIGVVLGGAVHDFIILFSSVRRKGKSLAEIARMEIGPVAGMTAAIAILFIIIIALSGLGLAVVNALRESAWGTFTIACSIPLALLMGLYMYRFRKGKIAEATVLGVIGLVLAVVFGENVAHSFLGPYFTFSKEQLTFLIAGYGLIASILPVWMLLCPRDYLSSFMKIGTIGFLILGVILVNPELRMPAVSQFADGGGPIIPGKLFPFLFITIACGAISGFHGLIGSGTTPKMIDKESHVRMIGYGTMLVEGLIGITTLIAACALYPADYFAINVEPGQFANLGMAPVNLPQLGRDVGEELTGRTGGAVSLAVGMAQIFSGMPGLQGLMSYWYHFAIMFEALFILTTIDTGTRVARFLVQEFLGKFFRPMEKTDWMPGTILSSLLVVSAWAYFIYTGNISTIWPMFGIANQLLAAVSLCIGTTVIINMGKARYAWVTALPLCFVATTTVTAGWQSVLDNFWPQGGFEGYLNCFLTFVMIGCLFIVLVASVWRWYVKATERTSAGTEPPGSVTEPELLS
jgi:carbon starvation protein